MIIAAEIGASRPRRATGIEIPEDALTQGPMERCKRAVDRLLYSETAPTRCGEVGQGDPRPYVKALAAKVQDIASITRTPPHYFLASMGNFPSGESLKSAETGLVSKARRKMRHFGESWEEVMRLAFLAIDDPRG